MKNHGTKGAGFWDFMAGSYDKQAFATFAEAYADSIEKVRFGIKSGDRVLDIGCGTGILSLGITDKAESVLGIDISPKMVAKAREKMRNLSVVNAEFRVYDGGALPVADQSFDAVLIFNVLMAVPDPAAMLAEAFRVLKKGGSLFLAADCLGEPLSFAENLRLFPVHIFQWVGLLPFFHRFTRAELEKIVEGRGFSLRGKAVLYDATANYFLEGVKL